MANSAAASSGALSALSVSHKSAASQSQENLTSTASASPGPSPAGSPPKTGGARDVSALVREAGSHKKSRRDFLKLSGKVSLGIISILADVLDSDSDSEDEHDAKDGGKDRVRTSTRRGEERSTVFELPKAGVDPKTGLEIVDDLSDTYVFRSPALPFLTFTCLPPCASCTFNFRFAFWPSINMHEYLLHVNNNVSSHSPPGSRRLGISRTSKKTSPAPPPSPPAPAPAPLPSSSGPRCRCAAGSEGVEGPRRRPRPPGRRPRPAAPRH